MVLVLTNLEMNYLECCPYACLNTLPVPKWFHEVLFIFNIYKNLYSVHVDMFIIKPYYTTLK
jgi:hypothetical protein